MEQQLFYIIIGTVFSLVTSLGLFIMKRMSNRLDQLEVDLQETVSDKHVRLLIADKVEPLADRMKNIEVKIDKLLDLAIIGNRKHG